MLPPVRRPQLRRHRQPQVSLPLAPFLHLLIVSRNDIIFIIIFVFIVIEVVFVFVFIIIEVVFVFVFIIIEVVFVFVFVIIDVVVVFVVIVPD